MAKESAGFSVGGIHGKHDAGKLKSTLAGLPGVTSVSVDTVAGNVIVDFDSTGTKKARLRDAIMELGFSIPGPRTENRE